MILTGALVCLVILMFLVLIFTLTSKPYQPIISKSTAPPSKLMVQIQSLVGVTRNPLVRKLLDTIINVFKIKDPTKPITRPRPNRPTTKPTPRPGLTKPIPRPELPTIINPNPDIETPTPELPTVITPTPLPGLPTVITPAPMPELPTLITPTPLPELPTVITPAPMPELPTDPDTEMPAVTPPLTTIEPPIPETPITAPEVLPEPLPPPELPSAPEVQEFKTASEEYDGSNYNPPSASNDYFNNSSKNLFNTINNFEDEESGYKLKRSKAFKRSPPPYNKKKSSDNLIKN
ncbi:DUF2413 [Dikerogammarus haemobaphes nudivirus]|nr:DUF2413 [Dikerogammarus haemobaphes nudivirus]